MPSYISFPADDTTLTGPNAKDQLTINPESTIFNLPRLIGLDFDDAVLQSEIKSLPFKVIDKNNVPYIQVNTNQGEKELAPEQASSIILSELKKKAEKHLGESVTHAIVTVPSSFNDAQRRAIMTAGSIANLKIMRLVNESTAAAIGSNNNTTSSRKSNVLVFKLGSGTFDVRLLTIDGNKFNVIASGGNTHLGGKDFDDRVMEYYIGLYRTESGTDLRKSKICMERLRLEVETAKRKLSYCQNASIEIGNFNKVITRATFEEINIDLFESTIETVRNVLQDAQMNKENVDRIVLSGGSTQIPKIRQLLKEFFVGKKLIHTVKLILKLVL